MNVMRTIVRNEATSASDDFDIATLQPGESLRFTRTQVGNHAPVHRAEATRQGALLSALNLPAVPSHKPSSSVDLPPEVQSIIAFNLMESMYGITSNDVSQAYWPRAQEALHRYNITAEQVYDVMHALKSYPSRGTLDTHKFDADLRHRALSVQIAVSGVAGLELPAVVIAQGRAIDWTRLTLFLGDGALSALAGLGAISASAAAAYMAAAAASSQAAGLKTAVGLGAKLKGSALALGYTVGATAAGVATAVAGAASVGYWYGYIQAYRDVWDNEVGRDAYLCHRLREHGVVPGQQATSCNHADGVFTSPNAMLAAHLSGRRRN